MIAGDNLFAYSLADFVGFWRSHGVASALAVHDVGSLELASRYGIVELDGDDRVIGFVEKPAEPPSTLAATATYLYHREHVPLVADYLAEGNQPDQPGRLIEWLHPRRPVFGYAFEGEWLDIGDPRQLLEADNRLRQPARPARARRVRPRVVGLFVAQSAQSGHGPVTASGVSSTSRAAGRPLPGGGTVGSWPDGTPARGPARNRHEVGPIRA